MRAAVASQVDPAGRLDFVAADLSADDGWADALAGVGGVLHVASPINGQDPRDVDAFVRPAVDGTLRVLRAAEAAGVPRVVVTSSMAAATPIPTGNVTIDETEWTDPNQPGLTEYRLSKAMAERAAWDYVARHPAVQLVTVLPGAILGPALPGVSRSSLLILDRMLGGGLPAMPRIELAIVDVRDLADLHVLALEHPDAAGERFLGVHETVTMPDIAELLRRDLGDAGAKVPRRAMPDAVVRLVARFNRELAPMASMLGRHLTVSGAKSERVLGWRPRPAEQTILDSAHFLIG